MYNSKKVLLFSGKVKVLEDKFRAALRKSDEGQRKGLKKLLLSQKTFTVKRMFNDPRVNKSTNSNKVIDPQN